ncbi:oxidoreductase [Clostridia bacterium]|nr:oxidoreductase [Clostridia bacterium]
MAKQKINIGLIGSGFMGRAHSFAWSNVSKFMDTDFEPVLKVMTYGSKKEAAEEFAEKWGWEELAKDWKEIVARDDIDIIDIVTPTYLHKEIAIAAAKAGKHIYCEKPCAISYADCLEMEKAVTEAGVVHYLNHNYRRVPAIEFAKKLIEEGKIGRIYHWRGAYLQDWILDPNFPLTWQFRKDMAGGGPLYDLGSHSVDLARYLVGEVKTVMAKNYTFTPERPLPGKEAVVFRAGSNNATETGKVEVDDASFMVVEFENGALGSFDVTRMAGGRKNYNHFEIYGSKGCLSWNFESMNELRFLNLEDPAGEQGYRTISATLGGHGQAGVWWGPGHVIGYENTFIHAAADFLKAVKDGSVITPNFTDGAKIIRVLEAAARSSEENRQVLVSEIA